MKRTSENALTEWLVVNCQMGDVDALQRLIEIWYPKLLRYASRQVNDPQKAEDTVQDTLEVMCKSLHKLQDPAVFSSWLYRILQYKTVDVIRYKQREDKFSRDYQQFVTLFLAEGLPDHKNLTFDQMLAKLPPALYQLVHLHYLEGLSMIEIGEILSLPAGTVKSRLYQARQYIRTHLTGETNG